MTDFDRRTSAYMAEFDRRTLAYMGNLALMTRIWSVTTMTRGATAVIR
jgi:hypothetical protein